MVHWVRTFLQFVLIQCIWLPHVTGGPCATRAMYDKLDISHPMSPSIPLHSVAHHESGPYCIMGYNQIIRWLLDLGRSYSRKRMWKQANMESTVHFYQTLRYEIYIWVPFIFEWPRVLSLYNNGQPRWPAEGGKEVFQTLMHDELLFFKKHKWPLNMDNNKYLAFFKFSLETVIW